MMESLVARAGIGWPRTLRRIDGEAVGIWVLTGALILYLALDGGGYDVVVHSQVAMIVWWLVLLGAGLKLLPAAWPTRTAWGAVSLLGAFAAWTAIATSWSISVERTLASLSLVVGYAGVLVLAVGLHRDREQALRHTLAAIATAVAIVAGFGVASRLFPDLFPAAGQTSAFVRGTQQRLSWPLNYWNALAALLALGLPLLLAITSSARRLAVQAAAAGAIPLLMLCGYLTFSRGGVLAAVIAALCFLALAPDRFPKLATALVAGGGGAALVAGAAHRSAIEHGLTNALARHQGATLVLPIVLVCGGVALAQVGIGLAARHGTPPPVLRVSRSTAQALLGAGLAVAITAALVAGAPHAISHAWRDFKHPNAAALHDYSIGRFGTASGNGRYAYWKAAVNATGGHVLGGSGPGTFELLWLPRATYFSYVQDAHSLYVETLAEDGVVGLGLLVGLFGLVLTAAVRLVTRSQDEARVRAAGATAALLAFMVSAAFDWVWQVPVLPVAFLLLAAAVMAPVRRAPRLISGGVRVWALRAGLATAAVCALIAVMIPLAATDALRASQTAVSTRNLAQALRDARQAARVEPAAASPQLQVALVAEERHDLGTAVVAADQATRDEPQNWTTWLVLSRLEAESGNPSAAVAAYRRARALNPKSPIFRSNGTRA